MLVNCGAMRVARWRPAVANGPDGPSLPRLSFSFLPSAGRPYFLPTLTLSLQASTLSPWCCSIPVVVAAAAVAAAVHGEQHHDLRAGLDPTRRVWFFCLLLQGRPFVSIDPQPERTRWLIMFILFYFVAVVAMVAAVAVVAVCHGAISSIVK